MRTFTQYINESVDSRLLTFIKALKCDYGVTKDMDSESPRGKYNKAKVQEKIFIDTFNDASEDYVAVGIEDYCKSTGQQYTHEYDSRNGDIVIMQGKKEVMFIDLKVANTENCYGTPEILSLVNFASSHSKMHYYLCAPISGSHPLLIEAGRLYDAVLSKEATVIASKRRKRISKGVEALNGKVKLVSPKGKDYDTTKLYDEDFVSTRAVESMR